LPSELRLRRHQRRNAGIGDRDRPLHIGARLPCPVRFVAAPLPDRTQTGARQGRDRPRLASRRIRLRRRLRRFADQRHMTRYFKSPLRPDAQPLPSLGARQGARKTVSRGAPSGRWSVFPGVDAPARSAVMELPEASIGAGPQCAETRPFRAQSVGQRGRGGSPRWWPLWLDILDTGCWISVKP